MIATSKRAPIHALIVDEQGNPVDVGGGTPGPESITTEMFAPDAKAPLAEKSDSTDSVTWANVSGKPSSFPPSTHNHTLAQVTGLQTALDGKMNRPPVQNIEPIPDPATATTEQVATAFNALLDALKNG